VEGLSRVSADFGFEPGFDALFLPKKAKNIAFFSSPRSHGAPGPFSVRFAGGGAVGLRFLN
jgi:hypothetical protein